MTGRDFLEQVEAAKLDGAQRIRVQVADARFDVAEALGVARETFGSTVQGVSVNEPLVDLHRELGEAERALANALNALAVLQHGTPAPVPAPARRDLGAPIRAPRS